MRICSEPGWYVSGIIFMVNPFKKLLMHFVNQTGILRVTVSG